MNICLLVQLHVFKVNVLLLANIYQVISNDMIEKLPLATGLSIGQVALANEGH